MEDAIDESDELANLAECDDEQGMTMVEILYKKGCRCLARENEQGVVNGWIDGGMTFTFTSRASTSPAP